MSKPKRKKKVSDTTKKLLSLEHDRTVAARRAAREDAAAEHAKRVPFSEATFKNPVRDLIRVMPAAELEKL